MTKETPAKFQTRITAPIKEALAKLEPFNNEIVKLEKGQLPFIIDAGKGFWAAKHEIKKAKIKTRSGKTKKIPWLPWLEAFCEQVGISPRTARLYMQVTKPEYKEYWQRVASLRELLELIREKNKANREDAEAEEDAESEEDADSADDETESADPGDQDEDSADNDDADDLPEPLMPRLAQGIKVGDLNLVAQSIFDGISGSLTKDEIRTVAIRLQTLADAMGWDQSVREDQPLMPSVPEAPPQLTLRRM
jgi:hypothetical protein